MYSLTNITIYKIHQTIFYHNSYSQKTTLYFGTYLLLQVYPIYRITLVNRFEKSLKKRLFLQYHNVKYDPPVQS